MSWLDGPGKWIVGALAILIVLLCAAPSPFLVAFGSAAHAAGQSRLAWQSYQAAVYAAGQHPPTSWLSKAHDLGTEVGETQSALADWWKEAEVLDYQQQKETDAKKGSEKREALERLLKLLLAAKEDARIRLWLAQLELAQDPAGAAITLLPLAEDREKPPPGCGSVENEAKGLYGLAEWANGAPENAINPLKAASSLAKFYELYTAVSARSNAVEQSHEIDQSRTAERQSNRERALAALRADLADHIATTHPNHSVLGALLLLGLAVVAPEFALGEGGLAETGAAEAGSAEAAGEGAAGVEGASAAAAESSEVAESAVVEDEYGNISLTRQVDGGEIFRLNQILQEYNTEWDQEAAALDARKQQALATISYEDQTASTAREYSQRDDLPGCPEPYSW